MSALVLRQIKTAAVHEARLLARVCGIDEAERKAEKAVA
jgi:hypothetical protein